MRCQRERCTKPITDRSPSPDFCSEDCQSLWYAQRRRPDPAAVAAATRWGAQMTGTSSYVAASQDENGQMVTRPMSAAEVQRMADQVNPTVAELAECTEAPVVNWLARWFGRHR